VERDAHGGRALPPRAAAEQALPMAARWGTMGSTIPGCLVNSFFMGHGAAGQHENSELIQVQTLQSARERGQLDHFKHFAKPCMAEYGLDGWTAPDLINPHDVNHWSAVFRSQTAGT